MIYIQLSCSMCGKFADKVLAEESKEADFARRIAKLAKPKGWILQQNGDNLDVYCSKKCAK